MNWTDAPITAHNLSRNFGKTEAIHDLDFKVPKGSIFALVGPNGAGKSTALRIFMNILRPSRGHATVLGRDSRRVSATTLQRIGYIAADQELPQSFRVGELIEYCRPLYPTWDPEVADQLIERFELPLESKIRATSRGMQRKLAMLLALSYRPELLILDEPFGALDVMACEDLEQELLDSAAAGTTVLVASHDLPMVERLADHLALLDRGHLRLLGERESLSAGFRRVEVLLAGDAPARHPPANWLQMETVGPVVRFIDARFSPSELESQIRSLYPEVREIDLSPASLRELFAAVLRSDLDFDEEVA